jgi:hypothetical protein
MGKARAPRRRKKKANDHPPDNPAAGAVTIPAPPRDQIIAWLLEGHRDADIREAAAARWPGSDPQQLINSAVEHFINAAKCDRRVIIGFGIEAYRDLYRRLIEIGDFTNAIRAIKELVNLATSTNVFDDDEPTPATSEGQIDRTN